MTTLLSIDINLAQRRSLGSLAFGDVKTDHTLLNLTNLHNFDKFILP